MAESKDELRRLAAGHRAREREKYLKKGPGAFDDRELTELLLYFGVARRDTVPAARLLLGKYRNLFHLLNASIPDLMEVEGVGPQTALLLSVCGEFARRYAKESVPEPCEIHRYSTAKEYLIAHMDLGVYEEMHMLSLDAQNRLIRHEIVSEGTPKKVLVDEQLICRKALAAGAVRVLVAHNHPSGVTEPTMEDYRTTQAILAGLNHLGITLVDHVIVGAGGKSYSFRKDPKINHMFVRQSSQYAADVGNEFIFDYDPSLDF